MSPPECVVSEERRHFDGVMGSLTLRSQWVGLVEVIFIHLLGLATPGCGDAMVWEGDQEVGEELEGVVLWTRLLRRGLGRGVCLLGFDRLRGGFRRLRLGI